MSQLKRTDWLQQGLTVLADVGPAGITIDGLCRTLEVTKGSFYHHFKNYRGFVAALLEYWETEFTTRFIAESQQGGSTPEQLQRLNQMVLQHYGPAEKRIRAWAQQDELVAAAQMRVDQRRIAYLYSIYSGFVDDAIQAQALAHLAYTALIGSQSIMPPLEREDYEAMTSLMALLVTRLGKDVP